MTHIPCFCQGLLGRILMLLSCAMVSIGAQAHSSGNSYLDFEWRDSGAVLRIDISVRDLDFVHDLDTDHDGQVTWAEIESRQSALLDWMSHGVTVTSPGHTCSLTARPPQASQRADGYYFSTEWSVKCPEVDGTLPIGVRLRYTLMAEEDNLHRGLLRVNLPSEQGSAILSPERPEAVLTQGEDSTWSLLQRYLIEGVWHIWTGTDHILFLLSLLVLAPLTRQRTSVLTWPARDHFREVFRDVITVVTAFTVAHSITLSITVLNWYQPPAGLVEPIIAASVVLAALNNLLGWFSFDRWRLAMFFGLIHGFGFASALVDLGLPSQSLALALGSFNLGVEGGQLAIVVAFLSLAWWLRHRLLYRWLVVVGGSVAIALIASVWTWQRLGS